MLNFPAALKIFIYTKPCDMRKQFDGLASIVSQDMKMDPLNGQVFVFFNKNRNRAKLLYWDESGFCIFAKRLERGRFHLYNWDSDFQSYVTSPKQLNLILDGIDFTRAKKLKRFTKGELSLN